MVLLDSVILYLNELTYIDMVEKDQLSHPTQKKNKYQFSSTTSYFFFKEFILSAQNSRYDKYMFIGSANI